MEKTKNYCKGLLWIVIFTLTWFISSQFFEYSFVDGVFNFNLFVQIVLFYIWALLFFIFGLEILIAALLLLKQLWRFLLK